MVGARRDRRRDTIKTVGADIRDLLNVPTWRAYDVDEAGRILAGDDTSGSVQLVELEPDGTVTRLTALPGACSGRYLPGERSVVVEHDRGGDERWQLSLLSLDQLPRTPVALDGLTDLVRDDRYFHKLADVGPGRIVYTTNRRNGIDFDVVLRELATGAETVVYDQGGAVLEASLARDGTNVALVRSVKQPMSSQLLAVDTSNGTVKTLTDDKDRAQHIQPYWSDGAKSLLATTDRDREFTVVAQLDLATGDWTELVSVPGHDVTGVLAPDEKQLLILTNDDGAVGLALHHASSGQLIRRVELPDQGWTGEPGLPVPVWSADSRFVALTFTSPVIPGSILRIDVETGVVTTVVDSAGPLDGVPLATPVAYRVPTRDGESVPCFVYRSPHPGHTALDGSAVLLIHGGPESQSVRNFSPLVQGLAAAGHTVVVPNVRGSTGYGKRWYSLDDVRLRLDSVADLSAVRDWLPSLGLDPSRAALWGGSYGGYMVLAGLSFQPGLWAAGVDIVGISSLVTFLENTSPYRRCLREPEYGSLEHDREFLDGASPLSRVDQIRTPLFVIHGANDPRVPLSEAEQLVSAVRANHVECELLVYPDEGHGLVKRANRLEAYPQAVAFLHRQLS